MSLFRDDPPRWRDLADEIVALLRRADEIDDDKWEPSDTIVLRSADLTAWGIPPRRDGPTLLLHRGGRDGKKRLLVYSTGDELPVPSCPWAERQPEEPGEPTADRDDEAAELPITRGKGRTSVNRRKKGGVASD